MPMMNASEATPPGTEAPGEFRLGVSEGYWEGLKDGLRIAADSVQELSPASARVIRHSLAALIAKGKRNED